MNFDEVELELEQPNTAKPKRRRTLAEAMAEHQAKYDACMARKILVFPPVYHQQKQTSELDTGFTAERGREIRSQTNDDGTVTEIIGRWSQWSAMKDGKTIKRFRLRDLRKALAC